MRRIILLAHFKNTVIKTVYGYKPIIMFLALKINDNNIFIDNIGILYKAKVGNNLSLQYRRTGV